MLRAKILKKLPDFTLDLTFEAHDEILVLFGPSGAGKTMTLRLLAGLERPDAGEIRLKDRLLFSRSARVNVPPRERRCGLVFQHLALFPHLDVLGNVRYGMHSRSAEAGRRLSRLLETFGIEHLARRRPAELSGGEQQRVAVARALMAEPDVLLLDEPFSALDYETRERIYDELLAAHELWRIPFLLVTHERAEAERLGDRILFLREGRQVEEGTERSRNREEPRGAPGASRSGPVARRTVERVTGAGDSAGRRRVRDLLAVEEPLEIVAAGAAGRAEGEGGATPISVTMRTPGADFDLVAGFLFAEGLVETAADLVAMRYCPGTDRSEQRYNRVEVTFAPGTVGREGGWDRRSFYTSSSCGVCGASSIDAVLSLGCPRVPDGPILREETLLALPARLREAQSLFERTGGLHAAALFDAEGTLLRIREDVGRHNAMDKLVGSSLIAGELPLAHRVVLLSGRLSFELVQKAARAGVGLLAGVSAPSSLAVELAERAGITLVGFLRGASFNVYTGGARVAPPHAAPEPGPDLKRS